MTPDEKIRAEVAHDLVDRTRELVQIVRSVMSGPPPFSGDDETLVLIMADAADLSADDVSEEFSGGEW